MASKVLLEAERTPLVQTQLQRWLIIAVGTVAVMGGAHLLDHISRGREYVLPLLGAVPTIWLGIVSYLLILPPLYLVARGRLLTAYWLFVGVAGGLLVGIGHLSPIAVEPAHMIYMDHAGHPVIGFLSMVILYSFFFSLIALIVTAVRVKLRGGAWL